MKDTAKSPEQLRKKRQVRRQTQGTSGSRSRSRSDDGRAFFPDPEDGPARAPDDLAEQMAEDFLKAATSGEDQDDDLLDATVSEEIGGPFVITSARQELAAGTDESNPADAKREPLPRAVTGLMTSPIIEEEADEDDEDADPDDAHALMEPDQVRRG